MLPDCGYAATAKHSEHAKLKDNWPHWKAGMLTAGMVVADVDIGDSRRKSSASGSRQVASEMVHWFSTKGLIAFMLYLSKYKTVLQARARNKALLKGFFIHTLPQDVARRLLAQSPPHHHKHLCEKFLEYADTCTHKPEMPDMQPPQAAIARFLVLGFHHWPDCGFWRAWMCDVIDEVAKHIDKSVDTFADYDYHSTKDAFLPGPTKKRRRVLDPHCKEWVQRKVAKGEHSSHAHAVKALSGLNRCQGSVWKKQDMGAYRAQMHFSFEHPLVLGLAMDASRVGRPSKELLCGTITDPVAGCHAVLPPQAMRASKKAKAEQGLCFLENRTTTPNTHL